MRKYSLMHRLVVTMWRKIALLLLFFVLIGGAVARNMPCFATCGRCYDDFEVGLTTLNELYVDFEMGLTTISPKAAKTVGKLTTDTEKCEKVFLAISTFSNNDVPRDEEETLPKEYEDFIDSLPDSVIDSLPEGALSNDSGALLDAAGKASGVSYLLGVVFDAFGGAVDGLLPTLALLCGIVILSAVAHTFSASVSPGLSAAVSFSARLCSYCAIAGVAVSSIGRLSEYFDSLCVAVGSFLPLLGVLYAMGGNLTAAASGTATLSATLAVCQFFLTETVIPVFCVCLSLTLLGAFDGVGGFAGQSVAATVKKWYTTALGFVMMIMTTAVAAQNILAIKADSAAMRGVKFAASSFIPISGGAVSSTLGTLAASVELIRGSVGVIGIVVILLMLLPVIIELAVLRGILSLVSFISGAIGCTGEQRLLGEVSSLYGYLEGIAALASVVFIIALAVFASTAAAVG